jgi:hypothetical protein
MRLQQTNRKMYDIQYQTQTQNNVGIQPYRRNPYTVMTTEYLQNENEMDGEGIMDMARALASGVASKGAQAAKWAWNNREALKTGAQIAKSAYLSEAGTSFRNNIPYASDETARPAFAGEKHAMLQLPNGKYGIANWMGPGTQVVKRLKRHDPPRTASDRVAMRHDIDYALAKGMKNKTQQIQKIREADNRMVASLNRISDNNGDAKKNIFQGRRLIQAKMAGEDMGIMTPGSFGGDLAPITKNDEILLRAERRQLEQQGYGLPGQALKQKLIKKIRNKKGKGLKLAGSGTSLAGGGCCKKQKGGFLSLIFAGIAALVAEATSAVTVASVGSAIATGAASAAGGVVASKILGAGKMKGKGSKEVVSKIASTLVRHKDKIIKAAKMVGLNFKESDVPVNIRKKAELALNLIKQNSNGKPDKTKILKVAKMLVPHIRKIVHEKIESKIRSSLPLSGGGLAGFDSKVLALVKKNL